MESHVSVRYFSDCHISVSMFPLFSPVQNPCSSVFISGRISAFCFRFGPSTLNSQITLLKQLPIAPDSSAPQVRITPDNSRQLSQKTGPIGSYGELWGAMGSKIEFPPQTTGQLGQQMVKDFHLSHFSFQLNPCPSVGHSGSESVVKFLLSAFASDHQPSTPKPSTI
jgi:hypothetical protein